MNEKNIIINISSGTFLRAILLGLLFVLLYILRDLVLVLLTSVVIASAIEPATRWFAKYRVPRIPAVIFVYVSIVAFIVMVLYLFIPPFLNEFSSLSSSLPQYIESINLINPITGTGAEGLVGDISKTFPLGEAIKSIQSAIVGFSNNIFQTLSTVFGGVFSFILIIIISFYLAVQE
ncbi:MAG: AI-2E family transporter, partial [Candidatus Yonathbacteria bacterium]|nr:AI-2E family transporter [Candidatus Yonathbacteria bacterium]